MKDKNDPLNIFNELKEMDLKNRDFFSNLTPEQQTQMQPYTMMRWASGCEGEYKDYTLIAINKFVNVGYADIKTEDKELLWKLMCIAGKGTKDRYSWIKPPSAKSSKTPKIDALIIEYNPDYNAMEVNIVKKNLTKKSLTDFCKSIGFADKEIKPYTEELKKIK